MNADGDNRPAPCRLCRGAQRVSCDPCGGAGTTSFKTRPSVEISRIVGTSWTAGAAYDGRWRHFLCTQKRGRTVKEAVVEMLAVCKGTGERFVSTAAFAAGICSPVASEEL